MERRPAISTAVVRHVLARQGAQCNWCGTKLGDLYDIDHVIPRCFLPRDDAGALQALCVSCHAEKTRIVEPHLIAAHKKPDTRVCWAGCKRIVSRAEYDEPLLACATCAVPLHQKLEADAAHKRQLEEEAARKLDTMHPSALLEHFRYAPTIAPRTTST
jgi:hypothetical protein